MIDSSMTPAVRRAYERSRQARLQKRLEARQKEQSGVAPDPPAPDSSSKMGPKGDAVPKIPSVYEDLYQSLTQTAAAKFRYSPANCPRPDDLCRSCPEAARCG